MQGHGETLCQPQVTTIKCLWLNCFYTILNGLTIKEISSVAMRSTQPVFSGHGTHKPKRCP